MVKNNLFATTLVASLALFSDLASSRLVVYGPQELQDLFPQEGKFIKNNLAQ